MNGTTEDDRLRSSRPFGLEDGTCYLIPGKQSETSYLLFQGLVEGGTPGLCITRRYPEKVRSRYRLDTVPVWWISYPPGDQNYAPTAIGILARVIARGVGDPPDRDGVETVPRPDFLRIPPCDAEARRPPFDESLEEQIARL